MGIKEVVESTGAQGGIFVVAFITDNLRKRAVHNFPGSQIDQGFDIILGPQPFAGGHFVMIADKLFRHRHHIIDDDHLVF